MRPAIRLVLIAVGGPVLGLLAVAVPWVITAFLMPVP
ncbi:MAG: hypothetical protein FD149_2467 [Rhodospirillaceae bacterium]|nr:MAG: hypothetical protein FD149_2467 [Rhodospirillaceae bacterium]